jgi:hypothetical protein
MAKIHEEILTVKLSCLVRDSGDEPVLSTAELADALVTVAEELAGKGVIVEVERLQ